MIPPALRTEATGIAETFTFGVFQPFKQFDHTFNYNHLFMRLLSTLLLLGIAISTVFAQEQKKETTVSLYGFIRNDFYLDTYKGLNSFNDLFYLYPNYIGMDANGKDINQQTEANLLSIVSRVGLNISGPLVFGAKTTGCLEADFAGKPEIYLLRLRKAFVLFNWTKTSLLVGQTWHPFGGGDIFPSVPSLNTGSPFRPFNRSPLMRLDYKMGNWTGSLSGVYQQQYMSYGPLGAANTYKRDAALPEMVIGIDHGKNGLNFGGNIDYNTIKPRVTTTGNDGKIYNSNEILGSLSYMIYGRYQHKSLVVLFQGFLGQNLAHMTLNSGYGISYYNPVTGEEHYTNYNGLFSMLNISYGTKWKPGILLGYAKNLGTSKPLYKFTVSGVECPTVWGLSTNIQSDYRICPSLSYSASKYLLSVEYELTAAQYGVGRFNFENGLYADVHNTVDHGTRIVMTYYF